MTKTSSSKKKPKASLEGPVLEKEKPLKPKKMGSEIDEIFAGKKRKRPEREKNLTTEKPAKVSAANAKSHDKMRIVKNGKGKVSKENQFTDTPSRSRKKTADGLAIYTEDELGIGNPEAGGTSLCPFDCNCCF
ncbi:uncharacterized protein C6G9.01c [Sesamum indicum]|uniref:Uncharacterized protein C6G9.01c n=1 Tax=Sesamum indicum TaxID=4182 RepID=A0A6I9UQZ8_SESIN|nr:uncharacterized protein C6G9.01c [Sesamum indicum]